MRGSGIAFPKTEAMFNSLSQVSSLVFARPNVSWPKTAQYYSVFSDYPGGRWSL